MGRKHIMAGLSLREAARETGRSKGAILRAIQAGGLSAERAENGAWSIDAGELFRIYERKPGRADEPRQAEPTTAHASASDEAAPNDSRGEVAPCDVASCEAAAGESDPGEAALRAAQLEVEIKALQAIVATERERRAEERQRMIEMRVEHSERIIELQSERDDWREQAKRLLALPAPPPAPPRRRWWQRRSA
jgi:hypothetical protein